jgi:AraC-like DNA-binding protein
MTPESSAEVRRFSFSSERFPERFDDRARRRKSHEFIEETFGSFDISFAADRPFYTRMDVTQFGPVLVYGFLASPVRIVRRPQDIARDGSDDFMIGLSCGRQRVLHRQLGREIELAPESLLLLSNGEPGELKSDGGARRLVRCLSIFVPRRRLLERVGYAEDLIARSIDADPVILRYLRRYLRHLVAADEDIGHPVIADHVTTTLLDLVALALSTGHDLGALPRRRGLRAARLLEILSAIKSGHADPAFSLPRVSAKLGLSPRYIQDLLCETGSSFTERVLEMRLQTARAMLSDARHDRLKVSEIAYACGFNEISYFNRCFRRRFGASPTQFRGAGHEPVERR